jgi:DNA-binding response OmpR family regulator
MSEQESRPASTTAAHILVVDDEPAIRLTLEAVLKRHSYRVTLAANGTEALAHLGAGYFDLLLLDLQLPDMTGEEVARQAQAAHPQVPILILTGSTPLFGRAEQQATSELTWIEKTASPLEVVALIAEALNGRSAAAG